MYVQLYFYSFPVISMSIFTLKTVLSSLLKLHSKSRIKQHKSFNFVLFKNYFDYCTCFEFSYRFQNQPINFYGEVIFTWIPLNLKTDFKRTDISTILSIPTHKHGMILCLFISDLISSINILLFLAYRFCTWFDGFQQTKLQN